MQTQPNNDRLFIGIYPCGISYSDRHNEEYGDYKKLAFLPYSSLALEIKPDCPADLRQEIETDAAAIIARRGEKFQTSTCGQYIILGA